MSIQTEKQAKQTIAREIRIHEAIQNINRELQSFTEKSSKYLKTK